MATFSTLTNSLFSNPVSYPTGPFFGRAVRAAVENPIGLYSMPNNAATTMLAGRGQACNRAFKTVECIFLTPYNDLKGLIVFVATQFTLSHIRVSFPQVVDQTPHSALSNFK